MPLHPEGQILCPHCDFPMAIQVSTISGPKINACWVCLKCECKYGGDGELELVGVRTEVCSHADDIGKRFA